MNARSALITGAARGIGRAIAARLARSGVTVIAVDIDKEGLAETVAAIRSAGGAADSFALDVADGRSIHSSIARLDALDVLVNDAAISDATPTSELTQDRIRRVLDVNLFGAIDLTLAALPLLTRSASPRVLNVASVQGIVGTRNSLAYATAKAGLLGFTRALAADVAEAGILVNALAPGFVDTPMAIVDGHSEYDSTLFRRVYVEHGGIPLRRPSTAQEQAEIAAFLCSPENTYITGETVVADGGMTSTFA
jgi:3-oxoacyl-[acyl-carrier protein] reductase